MVSKAWNYIKISLAVIGSVIGALFYWSGKRAARKIDEDRRTLDEDRKRLRDAAESGSDVAVLEEWRRSRGNGGE